MSNSEPLDRELPFQVGDWHVDPLNNEMRHGNTCVKLEPKVMDVLIYLAWHPNLVISREELEEHVWAGRVVTYDALTATIVKLRKAFLTVDASETTIKTVPKRGYCLITPSQQALVPDPPAALSTKADVKTETQQLPQQIPEPSVLANQENHGRPVPVPQSQIIKHRYFLPGLIIGIVFFIGLYLSFAYFPGLTNNTDTYHTSSLHSGTTDVEAQNAFNSAWKKIHSDTPPDYKDAIALLDRAILLDPDYGLAQAALAKIYWNTWLRNWHILVGTAPLPHTWELADTSLQQAMKSPTPLAYSVSSEMLYTNRHYEQAIAQGRKAIALSPNDPLTYATLARAQVFAGKPQAAKQSIDQAMQLSPQAPPDYLFTLGLIHFNSGQYQQAITALEKAVYADPQNHLVYVPLIAAYGLAGKREAVGPLIEQTNRLRKHCQLPLLNVSTPINPYANNPWPFKRPADVTRLQNGLRNSGLPEW